MKTPNPNNTLRLKLRLSIELVLFLALCFRNLEMDFKLPELRWSLSSVPEDLILLRADLRPVVDVIFQVRFNIRGRGLALGRMNEWEVKSTSWTWEECWQFKWWASKERGTRFGARQPAQPFRKVKVID